MATASRTNAPTDDAGMSATFMLPVTLFEGALQAQQAQLAAFMAWQQSVAALQKELWDEWVCRWGGGAPFDA